MPVEKLEPEKSPNAETGYRWSREISQAAEIEERLNWRTSCGWWKVRDFACHENYGELG
jgi:hypothetical protein